MQTPERFAWDCLDAVEDEGMDALIDLIRDRDAEAARRGWAEGFRRGYEVRGDES